MQKARDPFLVRGEAGELLLADVAEACQHLAIDRLLILKDG